MTGILFSRINFEEIIPIVEQPVSTNTSVVKREEKSETPPLRASEPGRTNLDFEDEETVNDRIDNRRNRFKPWRHPP
jgi:hypothetical protein